MAFLDSAMSFAKKAFSGVYVNIVAAAIIVLGGFIIGKLASRLVYKVLRELEVRSVLRQAGVSAPVERYASTAVAYLIYFIAVIMALNQLKIGTFILSMVAGAILIVLIVSFILSVKDFVPNAMAGFALYQRGLVRKGDIIETQGIVGAVTEITLTKTRIETSDGDIVYVPNSAMVRYGFTKKGKAKKRKK